MKHTRFVFAVPLLISLLVAVPTGARSNPSTLRAGALQPASAKVTTPYTNAAGDITISPPTGWLTSESETWSRYSDGTQDYSETLYMTDPSDYVSLTITATPAPEETIVEVQERFKGYYDDSTIISEGSIMVGTDTAYSIETKDSDYHQKNMVIIKNGWEYDIAVSTEPKKWKKYSAAIQATLASLRINVVK